MQMKRLDNFDLVDEYAQLAVMAEYCSSLKVDGDKLNHCLFDDEVKEFRVKVAELVHAMRTTLYERRALLYREMLERGMIDE